MKDIVKFLDVHYKNALKLVSNFDITKKKKWDPQIYLNELYVQLGHVYNVLFSNDNVNEDKRKIDNLGDELSDVLLQLINLAKIMNIDMYEIKALKDYSYDNINGISILLGQLTEAVMEINDCRFRKDRAGFDTSYDFVKDRLFKLFIITYNISKEYKLDMIEEFSAMCKDANGFLKRFRQGKRKTAEYIDIYDSKENLLGYCEKTKAHELGHWHKVFGCIVYNSKKNKVYFQLKNPKHNNIHSQELLEITAGGHLMSGETLEDGVREIKEETGLTVDFKELDFVEKRKVNVKVKENYIVKEFQYFYSLDRNITLNDFKDFDKEEVASFVELNIKDAIKLLTKKVERIKGKLLSDNQIINVDIELNNFDKAFVKDGLYLTLLTKLNVKKGEKVMNNKIRKLYKLINKNKKINPELYYFDDGKVCETKDYEKDNIKYSVMVVNTDVNTNNYLVYILIVSGSKSIPQMLVKEFNKKTGINKYFKELCELIEINSNSDIITKCYESKFKNKDTKFSFLKRIYSK